MSLKLDDLTKCYQNNADESQTTINTILSVVNNELKVETNAI